MNQSDTFLKAFPMTLIATTIIALILGFALDAIVAISFSLGSVTSLMMMSMLYKSSAKIVALTDKVKAQRQTILNYAFRFFFYALILVIAAVHPNLRVEFVAVGLFVFKIVLYILLFLEKKGGDQND